MLSILNKILFVSPSIQSLFQMETFTQFLDLFHDEVFKKKSAKLILNALLTKHPAGSLNDIQFAHQVCI